MIGFARIGRQAAWLFGGRLVAQGLTVLLTVLLAGRLGLAGLGEYAFVAAVVYLANVATTFGTDMILIRDIAAGGRADGWTAALAVQLGLSAGAIALIWLAAPLVPGQGADVVGALRVFSLSLVPAAVFSVSTAALRGIGAMGRLATLGVIAALVQLAAAWAFVHPGADLEPAMAVLLGAQVVAAAAAWAVCAVSAPSFRSVPKVASGDLARMARASAPIGVLGLLGVLYQRAGVIAVSLAVGPAATGWFAGAAKVVEASKSGHVALYGALYPAMATAHAGREGDRAGGRALDWSWRLSTGLAGCISAGLLLLGPLIVDRLYGPAFAPSSAAVAILALSVLPSTLATYGSLELVATGRERLVLPALLLSLAVLLGLLAVLIPSLGWIGACWAILAAETVQALALAAVRRGSRLGRVPYHRTALVREGLADGAR